MSLRSYGIVAAKYLWYLILFVVVLALLYTAAFAFAVGNANRWPFTVTETLTEWESLHIGQTAGQVYDHLLVPIETELIHHIKTNIGVTSSERVIATSDNYHLMKSQLVSALGVSYSNSLWEVAYIGCNCWVILKFENKTLSSILKYRYRGINFP